MTPQDRQVLNWVTIVMIALAIIAYFLSGWADSLTVLVALVVFIGWITLPRVLVLMCIAYHVVFFGIIGYIMMIAWMPLIDHKWYYIDGFRIFLLALTITAFVVGLGWSIASCFTSKALTETQIGQWTFSGWMPKSGWAKNIRNKPYGVFTGIPASMVKIIARDGTSRTISRKPTIQIAVYGSTPPRNFAAVFDLNFKVRINDTYVLLNNTYTDDDLVNLVIKALTGYLTEPGNQYTDVGDKLKSEIDVMQTRVITAIADSKTLFGVETGDFKLVDIENPERVIAQQIADEAAMKAEDASNAREKRDTDALIKQTKRILKEAKEAADDDNPMSYDQAAKLAQIQVGVVKSLSITGNAKPIVFTDARGGKKGKNSTT